MASVNCSAGNCGIAELFGLGASTREIVNTASLYAGKYPHIWFSDADVNGNAERLRQAIVAHGLGEVVQSRNAVNPNTKNLITAYIWTPNRTAIDKYLAATKI